MAFARIQTTILNHPKFHGLEPAAIGLWTMGNVYCWDQLTDGFIPRWQVPRLLPAVRPHRALALADLLVAATAGGRFRHGLWEPVFEAPRSPERAPERVPGGAGDTAGDAAQKCELLTGNGPIPVGYRVHDWLDHNPPRERLLEEREAAKLRMQQHRRANRSPERTYERSPERAPEHTPRSPVRSGVDLDVDKDIETPPERSGEQASSRTAPDPSRNYDCPEAPWRGRCVNAAWVQAHPDQHYPVSDARGTPKQCPHHRAQTERALRSPA